ncbi:MAG: redoxin domain-containing protein [Sediminibacterium sp.]
MKKKLARITLFLTISILVILTVSLAIKKEKHPGNPANLPLLNAVELDGQKINIETYSSVSNHKVVVIFDSDCDHCNYQIDDIKKNRKKFADIQVIFISAQPITIIREFAALKKIDHSEFAILSVPMTELSKSFDCSTFTSIHIFDSSNKLIKTFTGERSSDIILKEINRG